MNPLLAAVSDRVNECQALGDLALRESDLLQWLRATGYLDPRCDTQAALYRVHFLMRNALYHLAEIDESFGWQFSPIGVTWASISSGQTGAGKALSHSENSNLAGYYLDVKNLELDDHSIDQLLDGFWRQYRQYCDDLCGDTKAALVLMELERVDELAVLKAQYRRLVMQNHPDRGGSKEKMQALNSAFSLLKRSLS